MPERHHTAPSYVPATVDRPDVGAFIPREARPTVVMASNQASDWRVVVLAGLFLVLMTVVIWIVMHFGFHVEKGPAALIAIAIFAVAGRFALIIVNGDWVAHREIGANERVERKRLDEAAGVAHRHYDVLEMQEKNRHEEQMAQIQAHGLHSRITSDVAWLVEQVQALRPLLTDGSQPPSKAYVAGRPDDARLACEKWLMTLWDRDGHPKFAQGQLPMPWNGADWRGQPWCADAQQLLQQSGILVPRAGGRTFTVVPNSRRDAMTMLDAAR